MDVVHAIAKSKDQLGTSQVMSHLTINRANNQRQNSKVFQGYCNASGSHNLTMSCLRMSLASGSMSSLSSLRRQCQNTVMSWHALRCMTSVVPFRGCKWWGKGRWGIGNKPRYSRVYTRDPLTHLSSSQLLSPLTYTLSPRTHIYTT